MSTVEAQKPRVLPGHHGPTGITAAELATRHGMLLSQTSQWTWTLQGREGWAVHLRPHNGLWRHDRHRPVQLCFHLPRSNWTLHDAIVGAARAAKARCFRPTQQWLSGFND